jgi:tetratricopeptide (TPR) repeat protein
MAVSQLPPDSDNAASRFTVLGLCVLLVLAVFLVFGQTLRYEIPNWDDDVYVYQNPVVQKGLTWEGFRWALIYGDIGHWHPLTWLSLMLDHQVYGLNLGGYHLTNVLLHAATAILLFLVLRRMTGFLWRSAFVAAVFAIHPLRVESVAWLAERKDVLSAFFFMLTLGAYVGYVRRPPSMIRYGAVVLCFALGLLSKNMLVTMPFVLLLLDYWPLNRLSAFCPQILLRRVAEKIPLFVLTAGSCVATFLVPEKLPSSLRLPIGLRMENAVVSYVIYLWQMIYPSGLACLYPNPTNDLPLWQVAGAAGLLLALSGAAWTLRRTHPWLVVGWFWYLGMMVPVIGMVQISYYTHADRYTYLPQIGLYLAIVWTARDLTISWRNGRQILGVGALSVIVALMVCTWKQTSYWRTDEILWERALACTSGNYVAHNNLGYDLAHQGRPAEAIAHYQKALEINPDFAEAHNNLGTALLNQGRLEEASEHYHQALDKDPAFAEAHNNLGILLTKQGRTAEAIEQYRKAIELNPNRAEFYNNLGNLLAKQNQTDEAIEQFQKALEVEPDYAKAHYNLANIFIAQGRWDEAIEHYQRALKQMPDSTHSHYQLGLALQSRGKFTAAIAQLQKVLELDPKHIPAQNNLAWLLATCPDNSLRDGKRAVEVAQQAVQLSGGKSPEILDTLAAAYAEAGRFPEAVETAQRALDLSTAQNNKPLAQVIQNQLKLFETHSPYREKP